MLANDKRPWAVHPNRALTYAIDIYTSTEYVNRSIAICSSGRTTVASGPGPTTRIEVLELPSSGYLNSFYTGHVPIPSFEPLLLLRRPQAFPHSDWIFEVKYDGFRALAYAQYGSVRLTSRDGNLFASFKELSEIIGRKLKGTVVLDGEIVCLDEHGCSQFNQLLFRRGTPRFCAFDLLWLDGRDLHDLPLIERKRALRTIVPRHSDRLLYVDHVETDGERLFQLACERDLEGVVAKHRHSRYRVEGDNPAWLKIRNPRYSQMIGRDELFDRRYGPQGAPEFGWGVCDRACAAAMSNSAV